MRKLQPTFLSDEDIMRDIQLWGQKYANITENVIGYADELYDNYDCYASECPLGSFIADAYLHASQAHENENTSIAFVQAGGIRAPISPGSKFSFDLNKCHFSFNRILFLFEFQYSNYVWGSKSIASIWRYSRFIRRQWPRHCRCLGAQRRSYFFKGTSCQYNTTSLR